MVRFLGVFIRSAFLYHLRLWTKFITTVHTVVDDLVNTPICKPTSAARSVLGQPSRVVHACSPSAGQREVTRIRSSRFYSSACELAAGLNYVRPNLKINKKKIVD